MFPPHSLLAAGIDARFQVIAGVAASSRCSIISAEPLVLNSPKTVISALARVFSLLHAAREHVCARARATIQWAAAIVPVSIEDVQLELWSPPSRSWQSARASLWPRVRSRDLGWAGKCAFGQKERNYILNQITQNCSFKKIYCIMGVRWLES